MTTPMLAANPAAAAARSWAFLGPVEALLLLVAIVWGGSYSAAKIATEQVPVLQFLLLRFGLTFLLLLPALRGLAVAAWPSALAGRLRDLRRLAHHGIERGFPDQPLRGVHAAV